MTSIAIKSPFENDSVYTVFKLRALENLYFERKCSGLIYCGNNKALHQTLQAWCQKMEHPYKRVCLNNKIIPIGNVPKLEKTGDHQTDYQINSNYRFYFSGKNITDQIYIGSRLHSNPGQPQAHLSSGILPGPRRQINIGFEYSF